jgi:toxin ParE1/3/4
VTVAKLSTPALRDLHSAMVRIAEDSPRAAVELRTEVTRAAERLGAFPSLGVRRRDWTARPVRLLNLKRFPYVLVYDYEVSPPLILRVLHAARDLASILAQLETP